VVPQLCKKNEAEKITETLTDFTHGREKRGIFQGKGNYYPLFCWCFRDLKDSQRVESKLAVLRRVCHLEGFAVARAVLSRRKAVAAETSNAATEATEERDLARSVSARTPAVTSPASRINCARFNSLSNTSSCFRAWSAFSRAFSPNMRDPFGVGQEKQKAPASSAAIRQAAGKGERRSRHRGQ
jgi:hypothetical protein